MAVPSGSVAPLRAMIDGAAAILAEAGVASPRLDALALAAHALGVPRLVLATAPEPGEGFAAEFAELVDRRRQREPLQQIVGTAGFRYLTLRMAKDVFVPRPETEVVAQVAIDEAASLAAAGREPLVVDLCCGSGAIALSVDTEVPAARVVAADLSVQAVALTRENHAGNPSAGAVELRVEHGDTRDVALLEDLDGLVDVVVSNPPYIPPDAVPVDAEVRDHDPDLALYGGGADGLAVPRAVVDAAARLLAPGGLLVMEHAEVQAQAVRAQLAATGGFDRIETRKDLTGRDRMVVARRSDRPAVPARAADVEHSRS